MAHLLDRAAVDDLVTAAGDALAELLGIYFADADAQCAAIGTAIARGDREAVMEIAHRLRGGSLTLGAQHVAHVTLAIEDAAAGGDLSAARAQVPVLLEAVDLTRLAFECHPVAPGKEPRASLPH